MCESMIIMDCYFRSLRHQDADVSDGGPTGNFMPDGRSTTFRQVGRTAALDLHNQGEGQCSEARIRKAR